MKKSRILIFGSLALLLLVGCMKDADGNHIGGLEAGPAVIRYPNNTDPGDAQPYLYDGRWLLGDLKRRMQLSGIKWGEMDVENRRGVKLHVQSNMWGQADIDEIWIEVPKASLRRNRPIASFTVYFKKHDVQTYLVHNIHYAVAEPYLTSGGAVGFATDETRGTVPQYAMGFYSSNDSVKGVGFDGSGLATGYLLAPDGSTYQNTLIKDALNRVIVHEGVTNYGMFSESNAGFNHINTGYTLDDGYVGKVHCGIDLDTDDAVSLTNDLVLFEYPYERFREPVTVVKERHQIAKASSFLPGAYVISGFILAQEAVIATQSNARENGIGWVGTGEQLGDHGGATIVVRYVDGGQKSYDFDFLIEAGDATKSMATTAIELNPLEGTLIEYPVRLEQHPFYIESFPAGSSPFDEYTSPGFTWTYAAQRVIDKNIRPLRTIDLFE